MSEELILAQDIFLDKINQICSKFGLNNVMAQLYAWLYLTNKALSLDEMAERLKISKGSVSVNIRALERYGAVRRVWVKGSRRDYYEAESDIYKVIRERINALVQARLVEVEAMINSSNKALNSANSKANSREDNEAIKYFEQKLAELKNLRDKAQSLFNLLNSGFLNNMLSLENKKMSKEEAPV